jgi:hypothetical protein
MQTQNHSVMNNSYNWLEFYFIFLFPSVQKRQFINIHHQTT